MKEKKEVSHKSGKTEIRSQEVPINLYNKGTPRDGNTKDNGSGHKEFEHLLYEPLRIKTVPSFIQSHQNLSLFGRKLGMKMLNDRYTESSKYWSNLIKTLEKIILLLCLLPFILLHIFYLSWHRLCTIYELYTIPNYHQVNLELVFPKLDRTQVNMYL